MPSTVVGTVRTARYRERMWAFLVRLTRERGATAGRAPNAESLLVFYLPEAEAWESAVGRMEKAGYAAVRSHNPYWDRCGTTYEDADGYRVVLCRNGWENRPITAG